MRYTPGNLFEQEHNHPSIDNDCRSFNSIEAEKSVDKQRIKKLILKAMEEIGSGCSFRMIAAHLRLKDENIWKRLSELEKDGKIEVAGKKRDETTGRNVSLWTLKKN